MSTLERLSLWYESNCDGDWEHSFGIKVDTLDNPGWSVTIDLKGTPVEARQFAAIEDRYSDERQWLRCWREEASFLIRCGPSRLEEGLLLFLDWVEQVD